MSSPKKCQTQLFKKMSWSIPSLLDYPIFFHFCTNGLVGKCVPFTYQKYSVWNYRYTSGAGLPLLSINSLPVAEVPPPTFSFFHHIHYEDSILCSCNLSDSPVYYRCPTFVSIRVQTTTTSSFMRQLINKQGHVQYHVFSVWYGSFPLSWTNTAKQCNWLK